MGLGLLQAAIHASSDRRLRAGRLSRRAVRVDRREVLVLDRLRRASRERAEPRRAAGQRDALWASGRRSLLGAAVLGKLQQPRLLTGDGAQRLLDLSQGDLPHL